MTVSPHISPADLPAEGGTREGPRIALWLKLAYTAFMAVLIPVYWAHYGPTNFLYFCDVALLLTLVGVWTESARLISLPAVGILLPQFFWCADFLAELCGFHLTGMTSYMFDSSRPLFLRALSGFHGWLPFLLIFLLTRTGYDHRAFRTWTIAAIAVSGWIASFFITRVPAADPAKPLHPNFLAELWRQLRSMSRDRDLMRANWGNTAFWFVAALIGLNLPIFAEHAFHFSPRQISYLSMALSIGIAAGSGAAGYLSRGRIEYGLVPVGAAIMALSSVVLGWPGVSVTPFAIALATLGLGGGLFIVPIAAVLQHRPAPAEKGAVQGTANLVSWIGILISSGVQAVFGALHRPPEEVFWFCGLAALIAGLYITATRPGAVRELFTPRPQS